MTDQGTRREGWYADPLGEADLRWWDSQNWTTQVTTSRRGDSAPTGAPHPAPLQWAEDEPPTREPFGSRNRVSPPIAHPPAEPKFALGAKNANTAPEPEPTFTGGPDWSELALALLASGNNVVTVNAASIPPITIDMSQRTFWWDWSLDSFPAHPVDLVVDSAPRSAATTPPVAGRYCEPLLWRVGMRAEALAKRVDPSLRYKLRRWPDLASMPHTADQLRAITVLANAQLTITELGAIAEVSENEVRRLVAAFALMSLLDSVKDPAAAREK